MKKNSENDNAEQVSEMRAEYDFRGGVRGKHYNDFREGYTVVVHKEDGTDDVRTFMPIDADVREYFPDAESVNKALRGLINLIPAKRPKTRKKVQG